MTLIAMDRIRVDGGTQTRASTRHELIDEYFESLQLGASFPEVDVFHDGQFFWMADGFSRYFAKVRFQDDEIDAKIHEGGPREALLFAAGANAVHGAKRTNEDKRNAVRMILSDPEWHECSNRWIAEKCRVGDQLVAEVREQIDTSTAFSRSSNNEKDRKDEESGQNDTDQSSNDADSSANGRYRQHEKEEKAKEDGEEEKPKKRKGKDGKKRPAKAERKPKEKKSGQVTFDDTPYQPLFGKLMRFFDDRANAVGKGKWGEICLHADILEAMKVVDKLYKRWRDEDESD